MNLGEIHPLVEKAEVDLHGGRPEEEVLSSLLLFIDGDVEKAEGIIEAMGKVSSPHLGRLLLRWLETTPEKRIQKMIRRSLYRLKTRGIAIEDHSLGRETPVFRPAPSESPKGYGGPFDFLGHRLLMLSIPHTGRGVLVMQGILSDREGWIDFSAGVLGRKGLRDLFKTIQRETPFPLVEMEASYVSYLFDEAYHLSLRLGKRPPQGYLQLRREIETIKKVFDKAPVYSLISEDEIEAEARIFERGGELHQTDLFASWRFTEEEIRPYAEEFRMAEESRLILLPFQKEARFQEIYQKALTELFSEEVRWRYQRRMEEMAYYLFQSGRREEAKISLSVALVLRKPLNPIQPNPFLLQLVVKSILTFLSESQKRNQEEFSLITRP